MSAVARFSALESGVARRVVVDGTPIAVVRIDDEVFAVDDTCSHANVSLSEGLVWCESKQIECVRHGSAFSLETGNPDTLPATQPVAVHTVRIENDDVIVELKEVGK